MTPIMYGKQGMGYKAIAYALNDMHIPARKGEWSQTSIVNILTNEVYLGKIRWRREPVKKVVMKKATVYRTPDGEMSVHIYPKLPK